MSLEYSDQNHASGTFTVAATPAAVALTLGFRPSYVKVVNVTSLLQGEGFDGMADASYLLTTGSTGVVTLPTSAGFTLSSTGVTIGTGVQGSASDVCYWVAYR